jgi:trehalose 6-phosphate synthase/phosphatase
MHTLVIVSNRLPVNVTREKGKLQFNRSAGGLTTAMSSLEADDRIWIGWPGIPSDDLTRQEKVEIARELKKQGCFPVHLSRQQIAEFYEGYANDTLWPLFHYFPSYAQFHKDYWHAYQNVNKLFSAAVRKQASPDATVWIQDYQLMLLPAMVRHIIPDAKIGYFHHIPFPSYEIYRLLPERKELIKGLMGADLVGFHIYDYARHFSSSVNHLLGTTSEQGVIEYQGRRVKVDAFPIGIDYAQWRRQLAHPDTKAELARLDEHYAGKKVIVSVDRLDYSKGIMKRLMAYEDFLSSNPHHHKKVTLVMVATPSRTEVETYKNLRDEIEIAVSRINGIYSTGDWTPISYQFQNLGFEELVALYAKADIALVTPLRDGMNLVAKEYVAAKLPRPGVLILSEMAGAADELVESIIVNPNNIPSLSASIVEALKMPKSEQVTRLRAMQERIGDYTVQKWGKDFMDELTAARKSHLGALNKRLTAADAAGLLADYKKAKSRLILLDYDGTLHGFTNTIHANAAKPSAKLKTQLEKIASQPHTKLCIISGRPRRVLDSWFNDQKSIVLIAEHGAWMKEQGEWVQTAQHFDKKPVLELMKNYASRTAGSLVEEKDFAAVWHYRRVNPELAYVRNANLKRELRELVEGTELSVYKGNKTLEVKPTSVHKGDFAEQLVDKHKADFVLCAGDDFTDEDMFKALPQTAYTIKVGFGTTAARFQVGKLERILEIIQTMSKIK